MLETRVKNTTFKSESGTMRLFDKKHPLYLESGETLFPVDVVYETYGELSPKRNNVIIIMHALTGNATAVSHKNRTTPYPGWWDGLIGPGKGLDTGRYFLVCMNLLGSCYGTTGPVSLNPTTGKMYGMDFPVITTRDICRVYYELLKRMGIERVYAVTGGSLGGMLTWQFSVDYPEFIEKAIPIAGTPAASAWVIGFNEVARQAILNDLGNEDEWSSNSRSSGLKLARMIAMLTYRSEISLDAKFGRDTQMPFGKNLFREDNLFQVQSYLRYQGDKLVRRFDPFTYLTLIRTMDLQDISRGFEDLEEALAGISSEVHVIGIDTDRLFTAAELRNCVTILRNLGKKAEYYELNSIHGHDAFLIEFLQLNKFMKEILEGE